jgi:hypothetical protein
LRISATKKDIIWSYLGYFFNLGVNVIILPFVLRFLNQEELGIWYTFTSVYSLVIMIDIGFSTTFVKNLTYAWSGAKELQSEGISQVSDKETVNIHLYAVIYQTTKKILFILSGFVLLLMLTLGSAYIYSISISLDKHIVLIAYLIYSAGGWANVFFNYRLLALKSIGAYAGAQQSLVVSRAAQLLVSGIGVSMGGGLIVLASSYFLSGLIMRIVAGYIFKRCGEAKDFIHYDLSRVTKQEKQHTLKILWNNIKKASAATVAGTIMGQSGTLFCSKFIGVLETASYGLCLQLVLALCGIGRIFYDTNTAALTGAKIKQDIAAQKKIFSTAAVVFWMTVACGLVFLSVFGPALLNIIGSNTGFSRSVFIITGVYLLIEMNCSMHCHFISLSNTYPFARTYIMAAVFQTSVFGVLAFFYHITLMNILLISLLTRIIFFGFWWPAACLKELDLSVPRLFRLGFAQLYAYIKGAFYAKGK